MGADPIDHIPDIDETQLASSENAELYIFQYLSNTERSVLNAPTSLLKSKQADIEKTVLATTTSPIASQGTYKYPSPGRAIRNIAGRILVDIYTRGETRTAFDTIQTYIRAASEPSVRGVDRDVWRIAAFSCIGDLMEKFGAQYMSLVSEITTVSLKTAKSSASPLLRYHALNALRKTLLSAKKAVTDSALKDVFKQMKNNLTDKSLAIQRIAADVLRAAHSTPTQISQGEIESVITSCVKSLETADGPTRASLGQLVAHMLKSTQAERAPPEASTAKKDATKGKSTNLNGEEEEADNVQPSEPAKPLKTPAEMLSLLSVHFNKPQISRKTRVGLIHYYTMTLVDLGAQFVEKNYLVVVQHFMQEIVAPTANKSRYEVLLVRHLVSIVFRDLIGLRMLSEQGQIQAIIELANSYLKKWPAMMPGKTAPTSPVLVVALREVSGLVEQLGNAPPPVQDALADPLVTLLTHPSHSTRVAAAWTLRAFCHSTPLRLPRTLLSMIELLNRDISLLGAGASVSASDARQRALGHAYGLAALISTIPSRPLYASYDIPAKVFDVATGLLKRAGDHDIAIASTEIEVAWITIAALMSLGPNFVKQHLPQLLVLWRNALPKPTTKELGQPKQADQWQFLLHVRETALGAVLSFLKYNTETLVTLDVARRIASILSNALTFANHYLAHANASDQEADGSSSTIGRSERGMSPRIREALLRRRVFECFSALSKFPSVIDSSQAALLQATISTFSGSDEQASSAQATIAASSASFSTIWQGTDGYAYGVTSLDIMDRASVGDSENDERMSLDPIEYSLHELLRKPILGSFEHDALCLCDLPAQSDRQLWNEPSPPATAVVDASINLFSQLLPTQDLSTTTKTITSCVQATASTSMERHPARKSAVVVNMSIAILLALRVATSSNAPRFKEIIGDSKITSVLQPFLTNALIDGDHVLRLASSEAIGRLCNLAGTNYLAAQIKQLVDQVVNNRDPHGRAGCALAFGAIYTHVGGLAAVPLLKTTVNVLMSLGTDPHPIAHFWALKSLSTVINAASLSYDAFTPSTLGMLLKVYLLDSHEQEGGTLSNSNISGDCPTYAVVCQIIDAIIAVSGPELHSSHKTRNLVLALVREFSMEADERIGVYAIQCFQHLLMFTPDHIDIPSLVASFRKNLANPRRPLKHASINALYQLVQKDAVAMSKLGGDQLVEDLFSMLDDDSSVEGVRNVISSWLQQTVIHNASAWIDLCQRIMSRSTASQDAVNATGSMRDDEGESLSTGIVSESNATTRAQLNSRWRTQLFSLQCLHHICMTVAASGRQEHLDALFAKKSNMNVSSMLVSRVSDLIKMAFTASTAYVTEIRLEGLVVLQDVIHTFSRSPDPAFSDAPLLEQYQAPITAALTPAFSADSTPEILAAAIKACAIFVGSGIVQDANRMGRILKLLTSALEQSRGAGTFTLGESGELSPNASAMLRISTVSAWADLQLASGEHKYLVQVIEPHRAALSPLWVSALRDYASIRIDSEFLQETPLSSLDSSYYGLGKEVLLPYYSESWPALLQAVASAMEIEDPYVIAAIDGRDLSEKDASLTGTSGSYDEPKAFFFVLFGLVYEALVSNSSELTSTSTTRHSALVSALRALKSLVKPVYSGKALLEPTIYDEFTGLCYRLALTEAAFVQTPLIETLTAFATSQSPTTMDTRSPSMHCLRICAHILRRVLPRPSRFSLSGSQAQLTGMISAAFKAFTAVSIHSAGLQREDVRGAGVLLYSDLLKDENSPVDFVSPTLPSLKALLDFEPHADKESIARFSKLAHGLASACLLNVEEMRGREGAMAARKIKNNLLAAVLVLTVIPPSVQVGQPVVEHCCFLVSQTLRGGDELCLTAAHCARTLIVAATSGNMMLASCIRLLFPAFIEFVAQIAPSISEGNASEHHVLALLEVWKSFIIFFNSLPEIHRTEALCIILPTMIMALSGSTPSSASLRTQTVNQLLSLASQSPSSFKAATERLDPAAKSTLEQNIRRAVEGSSTATTGRSTAAPQISLRSF